MLLAEHPPSRVDILVGVCVGALSMLHSILPVPLDNLSNTVVLALILAGESADPVFFVGQKCSLVAIAIRVEVFAIALTLAIDVIAEVLIVIGVEGMANAGVISG